MNGRTARLMKATLAALVLASCGKAEERRETIDTISAAMEPGAAPGALDTNAMKVSPATRAGMDTSRADTARSDSGAHKN